MKKLTVKLTLVEEALGGAPNNKEVYTKFIASKAPDSASTEDEIAAIGVDGVVENGKTVFARTPDGVPALYDYHIKGMFKDDCQMLARLTGKDENGKKLAAANESSKLKAYKKVIDGLIFVKPRMIPFCSPSGSEVGVCERALRAQTLQGERIALACSETVPVGSTLTFEVICMDDSHVAAVREWLDYGLLRGIGQWRNSGKGRFTWEELACEDISFKELSGRRGA